MPYVIAQPCLDTTDRSCVAVCPVDCIHFEEEVDRKLHIDPSECIDRGACEPECPVDAIHPMERLPAKWAIFAEIDQLWAGYPAAARRLLEHHLAASAP